MKVLWDSIEAGVKYKGEVSDRTTGYPGTEQHVVYLGIGGDVLELFEYTPTGKPLENNKASDTGSSHVCFKTDDVNTLYEKLLANDVVVHYSPQIVVVAIVMYFRNPDGIILEAIEGKTKI
jgi:hypothetical protein